jgi:uncharacterized protein (DUF58 family)
MREWRFLKPADLQKLKNLLFAARLIVEGAYAGRHRSPYKGRSPEFVDYRQYNPGDDMRSVDWKACARTDRLFVKLFQKETDLNCHLLVDTSASMDFGGVRDHWFSSGAGVSKHQYACMLAAALSFLMIKQGDKVSIGMFDEQLGPCLPAGGTFGHLYKILHTLETSRPRHGTSVARSLDRAASLCRRRGLLVVISDFLDEPAAIFNALARYRHRHFEVILFHVLHPCERRLPEVGASQFVDSETGASITAHPAEVSAMYQEQMEAFLGAIQRLASRRNIGHHILCTDTPYHEALEHYILRRNAMT